MKYDAFVKKPIYKLVCVHDVLYSIQLSLLHKTAYMIYVM